jgi:hypothetical protein
MNPAYGSLFVLIYLLVSCRQPEKEIIQIPSTTPGFLKPPVDGVDVPFSEYTFNAAKGDTIYYKTGSIILFSPHSFVDQYGKLIEGDVVIKYREFKSPIDFYLAGIPMTYDSLGQSFVLESSGMCEIHAFKDGIPVFVNPDSQPEINLASNNNSADHNIYYLDTVERKWTNRGRSIVTSVSGEDKGPADLNSIEMQLVEPTEPRKANDKTQIIKIEIDSASFKELLVYHNQQFQLDVNEKDINPDDANEERTNVELLRGPGDGLYTVRFTNATKTVSYAARPVLEGKDYEDALIVFKKKQSEYQKLKKARIVNELKDRGETIVDTIMQDRLSSGRGRNSEKIRSLVKVRNEAIRKQNDVIWEINEGRSDFRTFTIDRLGNWNCDIPVLQSLIKIASTFVDSSGTLTVKDIAVFCKNVNSLFRYPDENIGVVKNHDNMIVGVSGGRFAFISYADYNALRINQDTKRMTFFMTVLSKEDNNYSKITAVTEK